MAPACRTFATQRCRLASRQTLNPSRSRNFPIAAPAGRWQHNGPWSTPSKTCPPGRRRRRATAGPQPPERSHDDVRQHNRPSGRPGGIWRRDRPGLSIRAGRHRLAAHGGHDGPLPWCQKRAVVHAPGATGKPAFLHVFTRAVRPLAGTVVWQVPPVRCVDAGRHRTRTARGRQHRARHRPGPHGRAEANAVVSRIPEHGRHSPGHDRYRLRRPDPRNAAHFVLRVPRRTTAPLRRR